MQLSLAENNAISLLMDNAIMPVGMLQEEFNAPSGKYIRELCMSRAARFVKKNKTFLCN